MSVLGVKVKKEVRKGEKREEERRERLHVARDSI